MARKHHRGQGELFNSAGRDMVQLVAAASSMTAPLSGHGTIMYSANQYLITLNYITLAYLYANNGLFAKAIDLPINDALSKGIEIKSSELDNDDIDTILEYMDDKKLWDTIESFEAWRNLFGGAGLVINTNQDPAEKFSGIQQGEPFELYDADRWQLVMSDLMVSNMNQYDYNPDFIPAFNINGVKIDRSRVLIGKGRRAPWHIRNRLQGWGMSKAEKMIRDLNLYLKTQNVLFEILDESKIDVYHIQGLATKLLSNQGRQVAQRIQTANQLKNIVNALVLDSNEQFESKTHSFSGLAEVMNENRIGIASALGVPMTKLFGLSPSGFSTGDSDLDSYYQTVESDERRQLKPVLKQVIDLVCQHLFGYVPRFKITFPPLKQLSEKEQEEIKNLKTDRILKLYEQRLLTPKETIQMAKKEQLLDIETAIERDVLPSGDQPDQTGTDRVIQIEHTNSAPVKKNGRTLKLVCELQNTTDANGAEHDPGNGQFTGDGGGSGQSAVREKVKVKKSDIEKLTPSKISGNELNKYSGNTLREKAVDYYKKELQGKPIKNPKLGEIEFTGWGRDKFHWSATTENRAKAITALPDIVKSEVVKEIPMYKERNDGIVKFYRTYQPIELSGKKYIASALIGEDKQGRKFYNLNEDSGNYIELENSNEKGSGGNPRLTAEPPKPDTEILPQTSGNINLSIEEFEAVLA